MGITVLEIVIRGGKSSVLWSRSAFYGSIGASPYNRIFIHKIDGLPPQMTIFNTVIPPNVFFA